MRPERLVLVCGTATEVGKTWVSARVLGTLRASGHSVAARKPAQSFDVDHAGHSHGGPTDAEVLAAATGEPPEEVCHPSRSYRRAMAPPIAAEALGLAPFTVADLAGEVRWPDEGTEVGLVETAGGVRSPQAADGDVCDLVDLLEPDLVVLVADAGLGTINGIRLSVDALAGRRGGRPATPVVVVLNRYDDHHEIHRRNREWLVDRDGYTVVTIPGGDQDLADLVVGDGLDDRGGR